jgi:hypothetical protein
MRRERVAAVDPLAAPANDAAGAAPVQPSAAAGTTAGAGVAVRPEASVRAGSVLFDPFYKASSKAHRGSAFANMPRAPAGCGGGGGGGGAGHRGAARHEHKAPYQMQQPSPAVAQVALTPAAVQLPPPSSSSPSSVVEALAAEFAAAETMRARARLDAADRAARAERELLALVPGVVVARWRRAVANGTGVLPSSEAPVAAAAAADAAQLPVASLPPLVIPSFVGGRTAAVVAIADATATASAAADAGSVAPPQQHHHQQQLAFAPFTLQHLPDVEWWDRPFLPAPSYALAPALPPLGGNDAASASALVAGASAVATAAAAAVASLAERIGRKQQAPVVASAAAAGATATVQLADAAISPKQHNRPTPLAVVTALPRKIGWNPPDAAAAEAAQLAAANNAALSLKTPEEMRKERHARRVAAARDREEQQRVDRARAHNFGLLQQHARSGAGDGDGAGASEASSAATAAPQARPAAPEPIAGLERVRVKHIHTTLLADVALDPTLGQRVRDAVRQRIQASLEADMQRHVDAKPRQIDHEWDVRRRHATDFPRLSVVRCLGVVDDRTVARFKLELCQMLLRGALLWVRAERVVVAVIVGGLRAVHKAEQLLLRRLRGGGGNGGGAQLVAADAGFDAVWGCLLSDAAIARSFFAEQSPFERDGSFRKPPAAASIAASTTDGSAAARASGGDEGGDGGGEDTRGKFESVSVVRCDTLASAMQWMGKHALDYAWDAVATTPVPFSFVAAGF